MMQTKQIHINFNMQLVKKVTFIALLMGFTSILMAQSTEYTMKAVALEKISLFITWPTNISDTAHSQEFVICVLGQCPFVDILKDVYKNKKVKDMEVRVITVSNIHELPDCQLLFIPNIKTSELSEVLDYTMGKSILTVSDTEGFAEAGCFINFYQYENKLRFEVNQKGMEDAGFTIDYRLLKVSKIINPVVK